MEVYKGRVFSDCNGTLFGSMYDQGSPSEKGVNVILLDYLIALKKSQYDVIIFSADLSNEDTIGFYSQSRTGDPNFFEHKGEIDISYEAILTHKDWVVGVPADAVFDDDHVSHRVKTDCKLNPSNQGVLNYMKEQLDVYQKTGSIEFKPEEMMQAQLVEEARLKSEMNQKFSGGAAENTNKKAVAPSETRGVSSSTSSAMKHAL